MRALPFRMPLAAFYGHAAVFGVDLVKQEKGPEPKVEAFSGPVTRLFT